MASWYSFKGMKQLLIALLLVVGVAEASPSIITQPRVLARVNDKVITTADVVQRMDRMLKMRAPQVLEQPTDRYQFYMAYWRPVLEEMVDSQLILADAAQREMTVEDGEVREEMHRQMGTNPHEKLAAMGKTYAEGLEMVRQELLIQRALGMNAQSKGFMSVTPAVIKAAYEARIVPQGQERWRYQVITLRSNDREAAAAAAQRLEALASKRDVPVDQWAERARNHDSRVTAQISEEFDRAATDLSEQHAKALAGLTSGQLTGPVFQSGAQGESIYRLFYVADYRKLEPPPFAEVEQQLRNSLVDEAISRETQKYITSLRRQYHAEELLSYPSSKLGDALFALY
jgi:hypothetical protein